MEHKHCFCISCGYSRTHTGGPEGKKILYDGQDAMCCFCGEMRDGVAKFQQAEGHGLLRHILLWEWKKDGNDKNANIKS